MSLPDGFLSVHDLTVSLCAALMVPEDMVARVLTGTESTMHVVWPLDTDSPEAFGEGDAGVKAGHGIFIETRTHVC
jgi:hypothetical protein